ncbi:conserved hypothetical protein [Solidesulfovibrio fructosivorans JJ]]|uniref:Uncharacterized protein n=1 Tax=Solidesulfovibrio fructosivorans JJ] TaxID=596151 RepID=E1JZT1_SOLFR|nr:hypothetical protein [Solidesulfovibrio fructosivorans]EFL50111.1 conserved hypothetical protein [Solidesulfovibrio fructosivorans JJ]]
MDWDFFAFFMPGERRPAPAARDAGILAARSLAGEYLSRARARLDGLAALLETDDRRDAALVAALLAEDLDAAGDVLAQDAVMRLAEVRAMLGPLPPAADLAAFAAKARARLAALEKALANRIAGPWRTDADRFTARAARRVRLALVVLVLVVAGAIVFGDAVAKKRRAFVAAVTLERQRAEATAALAGLADMAARAKAAAGKPLWEITGRNCSRCGCQGRDLRIVPDGDKCVRQWREALARIGHAAGASDKELARYARDPWGAPYLLNENEGESPDFPCLPDTFATAGQKGFAGDGDDIEAAVPNAFCPK